MKTAGIIKIVIGGVLALLLLSVTLGLFLGRGLGTSLAESGVLHIRGGEDGQSLLTPAPTAIPAPTESGAQPQEDAKAAGGRADAADGSYRIDPAQLSELEIDWIAGDVEIVAGTGQEIVLTETSDSELTESQTMRCRLSGGKLQVEYCDNLRNVWQWFLGGSYNMPSKSLRVELPASAAATLRELDIETVSANVLVSTNCGRSLDVESVSGSVRYEGLDMNELSVTTVSGDIGIVGCTADELDVECVSGDVTAGGSYGKLDAESTSGDIELSSDAVPREVEASTVSGRITLYLPRDAGFTARLETVSGELTSEFSVVMASNRLTSGDGACRCSFESVSGDVEIRIGG
ncbi:MAG: DUF4097 family beta strand repeat-containing protein [Clostridia bacterium]|nr:DUF4097 family beta strand repeat-containing protein [Clostridia bacterium]